MNRVSGRSVWRNDTWLEQAALIICYMTIIYGIGEAILGVDFHQGSLWKVHTVLWVFIPIAYFGPKIYRGLRKR
jgi:hypothetical protein